MCTSDGEFLLVCDLAQREGVLSLRQSGLRKVLQGITSLDEVIAASSDFH
jgi:type IV pilus assembly protein PilB